MRGLWESCVRAAKNSHVRGISEKVLMFEELTAVSQSNTVFCIIEAIVNSRQLCAQPVSDNFHEFKVLTVEHFLAGESLITAPEFALQAVPVI